MSITLTEGAATDYFDRRIFQRDAVNLNRSLTIAGTHSGANSVEARIVDDGTSNEVVTWSVVDAAPGAGTWTGSITVPQGGWYKYTLPTTAMEGWYEFEAYYDNGSNAFRFYGEAYYVGGLRINGTWSISETTRISSIKSDTVANRASLTTLQGLIAALNDLSTADVQTIIDGISIPTVSEIWANIIETNGNVTAQQALSLLLAVNAGEYDSATGIFKDPSGTSTRVTGTANENGDRAAITLTPSA